jgi:hypothetical protein
MLKKSASLSCSFGLFGLSGLFGCMRLTRWTRQTGVAPDMQASEVLLCQKWFSRSLLGLKLTLVDMALACLLTISVNFSGLIDLMR